MLLHAATELLAVCPIPKFSQLYSLSFPPNSGKSLLKIISELSVSIKKLRTTLCQIPTSKSWSGAPLGGGGGFPPRTSTDYYAHTHTHLHLNKTRLHQQKTIIKGQVYLHSQLDEPAAKIYSCSKVSWLLRMHLCYFTQVNCQWVCNSSYSGDRSITLLDLFCQWFLGQMLQSCTCVIECILSQHVESLYYFIIQNWTCSFELINQTMNGRPCKNINTRRFMLKFCITYVSWIALVDRNGLFYVILLYHLQSILSLDLWATKNRVARKPRSDKVFPGAHIALHSPNMTQPYIQRYFSAGTPLCKLFLRMMQAGTFTFPGTGITRLGASCHSTALLTN
jgi:hypothetical protein